MKISVICPECSWSGAVDGKLEGKKGKCPKCDARFLLKDMTSNTDEDQTIEAKIEFKNGKIVVKPA
jgi:DNA-directed RNA polymerase subunit RPC12/RpoP